MASRRIRVSRRMLFTWLVLASFILLFAPESFTGEFQLAFARVFCRPVSMLRNGSARNWPGQVRGDVVSRSRYNKLHNRLANITQWLRQERRKVETLSGLRDRPAWKGVNFVLAGVINASVDGLHGRLIVNRGREDGLAKGRFVMAQDSIIGVITDVSSRTARIRLLTDPACRIPVTVGDLDVAVVMQGRAGHSPGISLLSTKHRVQAEDVVCAREKPGLLPTPTIVGTVAQCRINPQNPLLWEISVRPACNFEDLTEVTVIVMNP